MKKEPTLVAQLDTPAQYLRATLLNEIGVNEAKPEAIFSENSGLLLDSLSRIYVVDPMEHEVRVFSDSGEFLFMFGRQGSGPGEFRRPCCLTG